MSRFWTEEQKNIVREMYPEHLASEIAEIIGKTVPAIHQMAINLGVKSTPEKIARTGRMSSNHPNVIASRYKKGNVPPNKGKKVSAEVYEKMKPHMFKKGETPLNYRPVGSERVNVEGYVEIKVADPKTWKLKHRVIWEEAHGPIPEGHNIQFKDGNSLNVQLDNLYMISKADQLRNENSSVARYPHELRQIIALKGAIKIKINDYNRKNQDGKES